MPPLSLARDRAAYSIQRTKEHTGPEIPKAEDRVVVQGFKSSGASSRAGRCGDRRPFGRSSRPASAGPRWRWADGVTYCCRWR